MRLWQQASVVLLVCVISNVEVTANTTKVICNLANPIVIASGLHAEHAVTFYASKFPQIDWKFKFLGNLIEKMPFVSAKSMVSAWVVNGTDTCDAMIGPGFSFLALALSPLVSIPWVDFSATATELSDKEAHPYFSRVIPTDEAGSQAVVQVMNKFGWKTVSVYCLDDAYGRSLLAGITRAIKGINGSVDVVRCLDASASIDRVKVAHDALVAGNSRIIFCAVIPDNDMFRHFIQVANESKSHLEHVFFSSEGSCSGAEHTYTQLGSGLCATYSIDEAKIAKFMDSYVRRDTSAVERRLHELGFDDEKLDGKLTETDLFAALGHDAVHHVMSALHSYHFTGATGDIIEYLRQHISVGASGTVMLNELGDRPFADTVVFNIRPADGVSGEFEHIEIGTVQDGNFTFLSELTQVYLMGKYFMQDEIPSDIKETGVAQQNLPPVWVMSLAVAVCALLLIAVYSIMKLHRMDPVLYARVMSSGVLTEVSKITLEIFSMGFMLGATYSVIQITGVASVVSIFYIALTVVALFSTIRVAVSRWKVLSSALSGGQTDEVSVDDLVSNESKVARAETLAVFARDFPYLILGFYATLKIHDIVVLASLLLSAGSLGNKTNVVLKTLREISDDIEDMLSKSMMSAKQLSGQVTCDEYLLCCSEIGMPPCASGNIEQPTAASDPVLLQKIGKLLANKNPQRYGALLSTTEKIIMFLRSMQVSRWEAFSIVLPYLHDALMQPPGANLLRPKRFTLTDVLKEAGIFKLVQETRKKNLLKKDSSNWGKLRALRQDAVDAELSAGATSGGNTPSTSSNPLANAQRKNDEVTVEEFFDV